MKVEVAVVGSPFLIALLVSVDVKQLELVFSTELRSCAKVEVVVLGSPSLVVLMVSVDVKQRLKKMKITQRPVVHGHKYHIIIC